MERSSCTQPGFSAVTMDSGGEPAQQEIMSKHPKKCLKRLLQSNPALLYPSVCLVCSKRSYFHQNNYTSSIVSELSCLHLLFVTKAGWPRQAKWALRPPEPQKAAGPLCANWFVVLWLIICVGITSLSQRSRHQNHFKTWSESKIFTIFHFTWSL